MESCLSGVGKSIPAISESSMGPDSRHSCQIGCLKALADQGYEMSLGFSVCSSDS